MIISGRRHIKRKSQIAKVLTKHGFGLLAEHFGLGRFVPFHWGILGHPRREIPYSAGEHLRMAFEELGPTFIKLGQILSTRQDLLPEEYIRELKKLQDRIPPAPTEEIKKVIEAELGKPPDKIFAEFNPEPLASASIGQVYKAKLKSGEEVVIKVQKPTVERTIKEDLVVLKDIVEIVEKRVRADIDLTSMFEEFSYLIENELDYIREARNAETFRKNFVNNDKVYIPKIFWEYTTSRILVMERLRGLKLSDVKDSGSIDNKHIINVASDMYMDMFFKHGFFHGDPHPGNIFVLEGNRIGLVDFGMVGVLEDIERMNFMQLLYGILKEDMSMVLDALLDLGVEVNTKNETLLRKELSTLFSYYINQPLENISLSKMINDLFRLANRYSMRFPPNLFLLLKTVGMVEGLLAEINPKFRFINVAEPYIKRSFRIFLSPKFLSKQAKRGTLLYAKMLMQSADKTKGILNKIEKGSLELSINYKGENNIINSLKKDINRLSLSIIALGFVILGVSLISNHTIAIPNKEIIFSAVGTVALFLIGLLMIKLYREGF